MNHFCFKLLLTIGISIAVLFISCQNSPKESNATYDIGLVESQKITLPIDENTYYLSKRIFQCEKNDKEYLAFGSFEKRAYEIILYDLEKQDIHKRVALSKEGPNGVPVASGFKPLGDSRIFLIFQNSASRLSIVDDKGNLVKYYSVRSKDGRFIPCYDGFSYFHLPSFMKDSVVYFHAETGKPDMKHYEWINVPMFSCLDLKTGKTGNPAINYPPIFTQNIKNVAGGDWFCYDYNYKEDLVVCSFTGYDSLMVSKDLKSAEWYNGKSRYLKSIKPKLYEANGLVWLREATESPAYHNIMYDKYRDVYYRFVEMPYELQPGDSPVEDPKAREFSVIIFDKDLNIIGETKFPGNKYFYKMSFVGRDGLYISENNLANPEFDEDKLVFACFKLENLNKKEQ